jgi:hypothetical protein
MTCIHPPLPTLHLLGERASAVKIGRRINSQGGSAMDGTRGIGRAMFAAVLLMIGGVLGIIYGIAAISNSSFFVHNTHYLFSSLKAWGWVALILGILELLAAISIFGGGTYGRWFGIFAASLVAIDALLDLPAYPFWSLAVFALSLYIIHGLIVYEDYGPGPDPGRV